MGKTHRRNATDKKFSCFEKYYEDRNSRSILWSEHPLLAEKFDRFDKEMWNARARDGRPTSVSGGPGSRKLYRSLTNRMIRRDTRAMITAGLKGDDWDDMCFPTQWEGKQFIWNVW